MVFEHGLWCTSHLCSLSLKNVGLKISLPYINNILLISKLVNHIINPDEGPVKHFFDINFFGFNENISNFCLDSRLQVDMFSG